MRNLNVFCRWVWWLQERERISGPATVNICFTFLSKDKRECRNLDYVFPFFNWMVFLQLCNLIASFYFYSTKQEDSRTMNSFDKELSLLAPCKNNAEFSWSQKGRQKSQSSGRQHPFKSPGNLSQNGGGDRKGRASYINSCPRGENLSNVVTRR